MSGHGRLPGHVDKHASGQTAECPQIRRKQLESSSGRTSLICLEIAEGKKIVECRWSVYNLAIQSADWRGDNC